MGIPTFRGVRLETRVRGDFLVPSFNQCFLNIASTLVFLSLPMKIVFLVAVMFLGTVSDIYSKAVYEWFDVRQHIAGLAARSIVSSATFLDLADEEVPAHRSSGELFRKAAISKVR